MEETFIKNKGNAGQKGIQFQLDLVTLCLLNTLRNHKNWKISTENADAAKFDDIVIDLAGEGAILIQAKHREKKKITKDQLLSDNSKQSDFSLAKYFFSYEKTKSKYPKKTVIICTNTAINNKDLQGILTTQVPKPGSVLYHKNDCSFYSLSDDILPDLKKSVEAYLETNPRDNNVSQTVITKKNLKDFLHNLQIFTCYPSEDQLREIIEQSLSCLTSSSLYRNISSQEIWKKVEDWFLQPKGVYLKEVRAKAMLCEIRSDKYCEALKDFNLSFDERNLYFAEFQGITHVKITDGYLLQMLKVYHGLQDNKRRKLYVNPEDPVEVQKNAVEAFKLRRYNSLIMAWTTVKDRTTKGEIISTLKTILMNDKFKQVIIMSDCNAELEQQFGLRNIFHIDESITFQDLSLECQERLMSSDHLLFQGERVTLREVLHTQTTEDYTKSLSSAMLEKLVRGTEIIVGARPLDLDPATAGYYINRRFGTNIDESCNNRNILTEETLYDVKQKLIVISDSAGTGKSTVLTKMAVTIKKTNPGLWILKIDLSAYTRILRDFVDAKRNQITAAELLNSLEATKMTNEFEELVFSMTGKVVLMLDAVDEISPDYTDLVLSLIIHSRKAPNFAKIFITTRPHVDLKLDEVETFQMLPFTRLEQRSFLTDYWMQSLKLSQENKDKCELYADVIIDRVSTWTTPSHDRQNLLTEVPLQIKMVADIFQGDIDEQGPAERTKRDDYVRTGDTESKLSKKFDIVELYDEFVEKKRNVFVNKGNPSGSVTATPALVSQFESCHAYHRNLAVRTLLPKYQELFSTSKEKTQISEEDMEEYILKIGIVQRLGDHVHFIHRTFAEYFLANSIDRKLEQAPPADFQWLLIDQLLCKDEFKMTRIFLDILLERRKEKEGLPSNIFKRYLSRKYEESNPDLMFKLAKEGHVTILQLILDNIHFKPIKGKSVKVKDWRLKIPFRKRNTLKDLAVLVRKAGVNVKTEQGETPLHLAVKEGNLEMVDFLVTRAADINMVVRGSGTALHLATSSNNYNMVKYLVDHCADINAKRFGGDTPLHVAVTSNETDIVEYLLKNGADINIKITQNNTALHMAAYWRNWNVVKCLVDHGVDINAEDDEGNTALHIAAKFNAAETVQYLLTHGAGANITNTKNNTALHIAAYSESWNIVKHLLDHGADVNAGWDKGLTALHVAAKFNEMHKIESLLLYGIDINISNDRNNTALHIAAFNKNWSIVKLLVENSADVDARGFEGVTSLHAAAQLNEITIIGYLLEHGANINTKTNRNSTALHVATNWRNWEVVKYLVDRGADVNAEGDKGFTALHVAATLNQLEIVGYLLRKGADINARNGKHNTALHMAAYNENWTVVKFLVDHGADVNTESGDGLTPLHVAAKFADIEIVEYLLRRVADINVKGSRNITALCVAAYNENWNIVKCLLEHDADVNAGCDEGLTALHVAVKFNEIHTVRHLLDQGIDVNMKNGRGNTALRIATYDDNWDMVKYLLDNGADDEGLSALHAAVKCSEIDKVKHLLSLGVDVNMKTGKNTTALHMAVCNKTWDIVKYLVEHGADVNAGNDEGLTALHMAVKFGEMEIVDYLLEHRADVNLKNSKHDTALHVATYNANWKMVKYLLAHGADLNAPGNKGLTALHVAIQFNEMDVVRHLVEHGADINMKNGENNTPLHLATYSENWNFVKYFVENTANVNSENNDISIVQYLLEHGADINLKNSNNDTALHTATYNENWNIVKYLVEHGADINAGGEDGMTALHMAAKFNEMEIVAYLLKHGADVNLKSSKDRSTSLHMAAYNENWNVFKYLVEHGADINARGGDGMTVLHVAAKFNEIDIVDYLVKRGADTNIKNSNDDTALHVATNNENWNILKYLVQHGACVNAKNNEGLTALHMAVQLNKTDIVGYLLERGADINMKNNRHNTALHMATYSQSWNFVKYFLKHDANVNSGSAEDCSMVRYLVEHGANVDARNAEGLTALHVAVKFNEMGTIGLLLEHDADINMRDGKYNTALHMATEDENWDMVKYLIKRGADVNAGDEEDLTVLQTAIMLNEIDIVEYVLEHGADINVKNRENRSALDLAMDYSHFEIAKFLVDYRISSLEHGDSDRNSGNPGLALLKFDTSSSLRHHIDT